MKKDAKGIKKDNSNTRHISAEEKDMLEKIFTKERERYETSLQIGGIDEQGNYTALHYRWEESFGSKKK